MENLLIWLIIAGVMLVAEIVSLGLTTIWFAGGAVVAAACSCFNVGWIPQVIVFSVVSLVLLFLMRPLAEKKLMKDTIKTNVESLVGAKAIVTEDIDNLNAKGTVKVNGLEWTARSADDTAISAGTTVTIRAIEGVKLMVTAENQEVES